MLKNIFLFVFLFTGLALGQFTSEHTGQHIDSTISNIDLAILKLDGQTIDGSVTAGEVCELTATGWNEADASAEATADGILGIYLGSRGTSGIKLWGE